jgi:small subunit ribosomal protein S8
MTNDTISNFITRIRNAVLVRHKIVQTPATKITTAIAKILKQEGLIENFEVVENSFSKSLLIFLKYKDRGKKPIINFLKRISKPGRRIYLNKKNLPQIIGSYGIAILSTSNGIVTNKNARLSSVGGEILIYIY